MLTSGFTQETNSSLLGESHVSNHSNLLSMQAFLALRHLTLPAHKNITFF